MARVNRDAAAQVIELLNVRPDDKVLEVGFGPGVAIQLLLQRLPTGSVAGVDQSQEMVRQAAARNADALRNRRVDLRYGSAERLPFADHTFDKALAINSMQAWPDARAGLGRYGACSSMAASWYSASLSTPGSQSMALRSRSPLPAFRRRKSWIDRSSSARSRQSRDAYVLRATAQ